MEEWAGCHTGTQLTRPKGKREEKNGPEECAESIGREATLFLLQCLVYTYNMYNVYLPPSIASMTSSWAAKGPQRERERLAQKWGRKRSRRSRSKSSSNETSLTKEIEEEEEAV